MQLQQCKPSFVLSFGSFAPRLFPCLSAGPRAVLLLEIAGSWWTQATELLFDEPNIEKGAFHWLQPHSQVLPGGLHPRLRLWSYSLELSFVFSQAKFLEMGKWNGSPSPQPSVNHCKLVPCLDLRSHWFDPVLPKVSLSSLLVSMKNASIIAPDGTQTNLDCQLRPTHFQGLCLTSVLFPPLPIKL